MLKVRLNLRKVVAIAICLAGFSVSNVLAQDNTTDQGVIINGVKWATRNVDKPGTFTNKPENAGMFYQWNRRIGWSTANPMINSNGDTTWDESNSIGDTWKNSNDPSPVGWRLPTIDEIKALIYTDKVSNEWTIQNGVKGLKFTDKATGNSIFLPAVGYRYYEDGTLELVDSYGGYWSGTKDDNNNDNAYYLDFLHISNRVDWSSYVRSYGFSVRAVAK